MFEPQMGTHAGYAVRDWTDVHKIEPWYVIGQYREDGQLREEGKTGRPSWFYVKSKEIYETN